MRDEAMRALRQLGWSYRRIGDAFGLSKATAIYVLSETSQAKQRANMRAYYAETKNEPAALRHRLDRENERRRGASA
jgi:N-acyl-L-homoserine lactone synthetase